MHLFAALVGLIVFTLYGVFGIGSDTTGYCALYLLTFCHALAIPVRGKKEIINLTTVNS